MFEIRRSEDCITLHGRFDAAQTEAASDLLDEVSESTTLDFSELDYISSAGLGVLLATQKRLMAGGHGLRLRNLNPHIREIFEMAGFTRIFEIG